MSSTQGKLYSQQDIANRLGTSKSTVYRYIRAHKVKASRQQGKRLLYSEDVLEQLRAAFIRKAQEQTQPQHKSSNAEVIELLKNQLKDKDRQIHRLNLEKDDLSGKIDHLMVLLGQEQQKQLKAPQKATTGTETHSNTEAEESTENKEKTTKQPDKRHWWQILFGN